MNTEEKIKAIKAFSWVVKGVLWLFTITMMLGLMFGPVVYFVFIKGE